MPTVLSIDSGSGGTRELVLAEGGYHVLHAGNLHQATELFRSSTIDAIVLDAGSSLSTITPFASLLKTAKPKIPVLVITDAPAPGGEHESGSACFDAIMCRLDGPAALLERLQKLLSRTAAGTNMSLKAATTARRSAGELRSRMRELRGQLRRTREISEQIRDPKRSA